MSTLEVREPFRKENTPSPMIRYEVMDDLKAKVELAISDLARYLTDKKSVVVISA